MISLDKNRINASAGTVFRLLLESELSEAELVATLAISATMLLAAHTTTHQELVEKLEKLGPFTVAYAKANLEAFTRAQRAKADMDLQ